MKKVNKNALKIVERAARKAVIRGIDGFPPPCMGIFHQPKRPKRFG